MNQKEVNINIYIIVEKESTDNHTVNNSSENIDDQKNGRTVGRIKVCGLMFLSSFAVTKKPVGSYKSK